MSPKAGLGASLMLALHLPWGRGEVKHPFSAKIMLEKAAASV